AAESSMGSACEGKRQVAQPVAIRPRVVIQVGNDLAARGMKTGGAGSCEAAILGVDEANVVLARDHTRRVGGAVVHDDHLEVRVIQLLQTVETTGQRLLPVEGADDDRYSRPL